MKRFKFRLQKVLDYRARICEEKRQELGRKNFERDQAIEHLENLRNSLRGLRYVEGGTESASMPGVASGPVVSVHQFIMVGNYATRLEKEIEQQMVVVEEASEAAEKARLIYVEASKDVKALDTLKEKKLSDYNEERLKSEEQFLDEMTVQRFKRGASRQK
jgi:flagellar FliJ protein